MTKPLERLLTYLSYRGSGPDIVRNKVLNNEVLKNLFCNEVSFWVIVTGPLKRLPTYLDRKSTRLNSSHLARSRMPSSA